MAIEVKLPKLGEGIESGDVLDVFVSEGDVIKKDQAILEIETDKASVEVPSSHAGKVTKVLVASGQTIAVGSAIITLEPADSPEKAAAPNPKPPVAESKPTAPKAESAPTPTPEPVQPTKAAAPAPKPAPPASAPAPSVAAVTSTSGAIAPAGPAIRRLAREVGVDLNGVTGTGPSGRITREDVLAVVRQGQQPAPVANSSPAATVESSEPQSAASLDSGAASDAWGPISIEPMTKIRKTISSKMHESWSAVPRVTNFDDADISELEEIRQASKKDYASRGVKLTSMPFLIKAVALSLRSNPTINASIDEANQQIVYKQYVNVGIAVDTERGLVVPALRNADRMSIFEIARSLAAMADNVRSNNFKIDDLRGGTFTISNLGAIGGTYSTPIINVPEVAILLVGRSRKMPVVVDDEIQIRMMMPLSLSYDHRLVDGATAARFLNDVKGYLEAPSRLLIAPV
ncbi:MAG: 2-oxo acid dehydrogenase subunit E2 [Planctomycetales bacterium]|nr:2-oxo acid dehydrogenase subunit E2 [Planctomycetales bacterium]